MGGFSHIPRKGDVLYTKEGNPVHSLAAVLSTYLAYAPDRPSECVGVVAGRGLQKAT